MIFLIPNFFYAIILWVTYSHLPDLSDTAPFSKELYLSLIGVIKYAPSISLSLVLGDLANRRLSKKSFILGIVLFSLVFAAFIPVAEGAISNLILLTFVVLMAALYEPTVNMICSEVAEEKGNYLFVNNSQLVSRTGARFLAPLLFTYFLARYFAVPATLVILLIGALPFAFMMKVPQGVGGEKGKANVLVKNVIASIMGSKPVLVLTVVYCLFYLSVSYLEYFAFLIDKDSSIKLALLFSFLGMGFLFINLVFLVKKPNRSFQNMYLSVSLLASGASLMALPFVADKVKLLLVFIIGIANGGAVPVAMAIFQEVLKKEKIGSFIGFLLMVINMCAVLSMGMAYVLTKAFSFEAVFMVNGLIIGFGGLLIFSSYKKGYLNV